MLLTLTLRTCRHFRLGFTLIELLLCITIISVLLMVGLPSYRAQTIAVGRAEAKTELLRLVAEQERYFSLYNTYVDDASPLSVPSVSGRSRQTVTGLYSLSVSACGDTPLSGCFIATAQAQGAQLQDTCISFSVGSRGTRSSISNAKDENCWLR